MKQHKIIFVKKGILFVIIITGLISVLNLAYLKLIEPKKIIERKEAIYEKFLKDLNNPEIDFAFFGDSHTESGLNPLYIDGHSFNFALGGESYIETYYKLKKIIEKDKVKIKNIILEVDLHTFSEKCHPKDILFGQLYFYSQIVDLKKIAQLKDESLIPLFFRKNILVLGKGKEFVKNILRPDEVTPIYLGWTNNHTRTKNYYLNNKYQIAQKIYRVHFSENPIKIEKQTFNYFFNILELAKENNINVIFIKYPISKEYDLEIRKHNLNKKKYYDKIFSEVNEVLNNYAILDYYDIFFNNPEYFYDAEHLTIEGSEVFSRGVNEDFKNINEYTYIGNKKLSDN